MYIYIVLIKYQSNKICSVTTVILKLISTKDTGRKTFIFSDGCSGKNVEFFVCSQNRLRTNQGI